MSNPKVAHTLASVLTLHFTGEPVSLVSERDHEMLPEQRAAYRAWALVCPTAWGRTSWRDRVSAVLHLHDLEEAKITIEEVKAAVEFYTGESPTIRRAPLHSDPTLETYIVTAPGYSAGPCH